MTNQYLMTPVAYITRHIQPTILTDMHTSCAIHV